MSDFHELKISEVQKLTPNSVCVTFDVPEDKKELFRFIPGQYITLKKNLDGTEVRRSYSICTPPSSSKLSVGIKKVKGGSFSVYANEQLKAGDTLEVMKPEGRFTLETNPAEKKHYIAFAAGSGITPILSIASAALEEEPESNFYLIYGNQSEEEMMFRAEIAALKEQYAERFSVEYLFSRRREDYGLFGRIERSTVNYLLKSRFERETFDAYYLCGPEDMINVMSALITESGVSSEVIHTELFSSSEEGFTDEIKEGASEVTLILDDETATFTMQQETSVLDATLNEGYDAPYSCQGGICSTCIAKLTEGTVTMRKNQILTDDELEEGYILTCQAHPTSAKITVDYDDV